MRTGPTRIDSLVLAGSVLKSSFPWQDLVGTCVDRVVNECGTRDVVLLFSQFLVLFTGMAGRVGFTGPKNDTLRDRYFDMGHSGFCIRNGKLSDEFMSQHWIPPLTTNTPIPEIPDERPMTPWAGFKTFLLNNLEPLKLLVYMLPLMVAFIWISGLYRQAAVQRDATQRVLDIALRSIQSLSHISRREGDDIRSDTVPISRRGLEGLVLTQYWNLLHPKPQPLPPDEAYLSHVRARILMWYAESLLRVTLYGLKAEDFIPDEPVQDAVSALGSARRILVELLGATPESGALHFDLGNTLILAARCSEDEDPNRSLGSLKESLVHLGKAASESPDETRILESVTEAYRLAALLTAKHPLPNRDPDWDSDRWFSMAIKSFEALVAHASKDPALNFGSPIEYAERQGYVEMDYAEYLDGQKRIQEATSWYIRAWQTLYGVGNDYENAAEFTEGVRVLTNAKPIAERMAKEHPDSASNLKRLAHSCNALGSAQLSANNRRDALENFEEALDLCKRGSAAFPQDWEFDQCLGGAYHNLADLFLLDEEKGVDKAQECISLAVTIQAAVLQTHPDSLVDLEFLRNHKVSEVEILWRRQKTEGARVALKDLLNTIGRDCAKMTERNDVKPDDWKAIADASMAISQTAHKLGSPELEYSALQSSLSSLNRSGLSTEAVLIDKLRVLISLAQRSLDMGLRDDSLVFRESLRVLHDKIVEWRRKGRYRDYILQAEHVLAN